MARFRGNVHGGSDRLAATLLFIVLLIAILMLAWYIARPTEFVAFWDGLADALNINR